MRTAKIPYSSYLIFILFLYQQFITWHTVADCGSYFITMYKRNRLTGELKLKRERKGRITNRKGKEMKN